MRGLRIATLTIAVLVAGAPAARAQDEPLTRRQACT
jgi:hypothetical protein